MVCKVLLTARYLSGFALTDNNYNDKKTCSFLMVSNIQVLALSGLLKLIVQILAHNDIFRVFCNILFLIEDADPLDDSSVEIAAVKDDNINQVIKLQASWNVSVRTSQVQANTVILDKIS